MKKLKIIRLACCVLLFCFFSIQAMAQSYEIDASRVIKNDIKPINMEATNPQGHMLSVNNQYFEKDGKPWFPLMGEMHYNRVPWQSWEEEILKMKSAGLTIIATYIFWNEHELKKGVWDWKDNRDLKHFLELCKKHGMYVWLRIGPWSHGEQLNGGFPDWIEQMKGKRTNDSAYLAEVTKLFDQVSKKTNNQYFKSGGPIIGVQLENEYASGEQGHISTLKEIALNAGIQPVYWSVTANTVFDDSRMEVIPLQGAYPYRGWEKGGGEATKDFLYGNDQWIMTNAIGKVYYDLSKFPKGLCEQGCGSQMTFRNRFVVEPEVVEAHLQNQIGRGMNLVGYYMFHGGTQTPGLEEPGLPLSYDFQAPVSEFGLIRPSYKYLKIHHNFINDFGSDLVQMQPVEPANPVRDETNTKDLRYIARVNNNSGFLFLCNTQVRMRMPDKQVAPKIKLPDETISFPSFLLKGQTTATLPFNLKAHGVLLKYATAEAFARINNGGHQTIFFQILPGVVPQLAIDASFIKNTKADGWIKKKEGNQIEFTQVSDNVIDFTDKNDNKITFVFLTRMEAENAWRGNIKGKQVLLITNADVVIDNYSIQLLQLNNPSFKFKIYPSGINAFAGKALRKNKKNPVFDEYDFAEQKVSPLIKITKQNSKAIITLPNNLPRNIHDIILKTEYYGSSCDVIVQGKTVTDHLINGAPWNLGIKRFLGKDSLTLQIKEWDNNITGVPDELVKQIKSHEPSFEKIEILPLYSLQLKF